MKVGVDIGNNSCWARLYSKNTNVPWIFGQMMTESGNEVQYFHIHSYRVGHLARGDLRAISHSQLALFRLLLMVLDVNMSSAPP